VVPGHKRTKLTHRHFALLSEYEFNFDAQLSLTVDHAIEQLVVLANKHKTLRVIINHAGWPPAHNDINGQIEWKLNLRKLAKCENIAIKLSGWEMTNRTWQPQHATDVIENSLATLGDTRVMLASNFPLCLFAMSYADLWSRYAALIKISPQCFQKITFSNALDWYGF
jgi:L-fuconolactonase